MKKITVVGLSLLISTMAILATENTQVTYPKNYKEWTHIKTLIIKPEHPMGNIFHGIHHIYANNKAYEGYKSGTFEDGSVIVLDFLNYADVNETISETSRIYVATMKKESKKYSKTYGWGYEAFKGNTEKKLVNDVDKMCVKCHESQVKNNYVFSKIRK